MTKCCFCWKLTKSPLFCLVDLVSSQTSVSPVCMWVRSHTALYAAGLRRTGYHCLIWLCHSFSPSVFLCFHNCLSCAHENTCTCGGQTQLKGVGPGDHTWVFRLGSECCNLPSPALCYSAISHWIVGFDVFKPSVDCELTYWLLCVLRESWGTTWLYGTVVWDRVGILTRCFCGTMPVT